eukprot:3938624-Rhodomonas_salina.1
MLSAGAQRSERSEKYAVILREFVDSLVVKAKGDVLEWALEWWLRLRLALVGKEEVTLQKLFQIVDDVPPSQPYFNTAMDVTFVGRDVKVISYAGEPSSYEDAAGFMQNLDTITLLPGEPAIVHPHPREAFDLLLAVRANSGNIFIVCLDTTSSDGDGSSHGLPNRGMQSAHTRK